MNKAKSTSTLGSLRDLGFSSGSNPVTREISPNLTVKFDGFHVSYNNSAIDYGCPTTAIVLKGRVFFILNGNHCKDLVAAAKSNGIQGCVDYFIEHLDQANGHSEHPMAVGLRCDPFALYKTTLESFGEANIDRISEAVQNLERKNLLTERVSP